MTPSVMAAGLGSIALYLVPFVVVFAIRARRERRLWSIALDLPLTAAIDLLTVLLASRVVPLEVAVVASRPIWLAAAAGAIFARRRAGDPLRWPKALGRREALVALAAASLVIWVCSWISAEYFVWDSEWHTSLVTGLGPQRIPFVNALAHDDVLHYHFTGDVLAALFRTLSFDVFSSNRALATAHDAMLALSAATVALLALDRGAKRGWPAAMLGLAVVLNGPIPLRGNLGFPGLGYAYHSFLNLSYRPHMALAALLLIGLFGAVATRLDGLGWPAVPRVLPYLASYVGLLAVTDESSTALACLALGTIWLVRPDVVARGRWRGALVLAGLAVSIVLANLVFDAALAPGGPVQKLMLAPSWQVPSLSVSFPSLPLSTGLGRRILFVDLLPLLAAWSAVALHAARTRDRARGLLALYSAVVVMAALPLALRLEINGDATEAHRFFVAPFFVVVLFAALELHRMPGGSTERLLAMIGLLIPCVLSVVWAHEGAQQFMKPQAVGTRPDLGGDVFASNCRTIAGARLFDRARVLYVEQSQFFRYVGCRPVFSPANSLGSWTTKIDPITSPFAQLRALDHELGTKELEAICRADKVADPVCTVALRARSSCREEGSDFLRCPLDAATRQRLLGVR